MPRLLCMALLLTLAGHGIVSAQVLNPTTVEFTPSADHGVLLPDGRPAVERYSMDIYLTGAAKPFQSTNIGMPNPGSDGLIRYNFASEVVGWPLPGGTYEARVAAIGPNGFGVSTPSNPFTFSSSSPAPCTYRLSAASASLPAVGGGTQVSVTTTSGCNWTAASNATWVTLNSGGMTGSGTVVGTIAANGTSSTRTATLTVAGQLFTINQAGTASAGLPAPWASQDVGVVGKAGTSSYASGRFTVAGSGSDIWGSADSFHLVHQPMTGDGDIVARVVSLQNTHAYAKAGVMLRAGLGSGAAHVVLDVVPGGGVEFMSRKASGGATTYLGGTTQLAPAWLRLSRRGTTVTASVSADGLAWRSVGTVTVSLPSTLSAGLAVTSHSTSALSTAVFDSVSVVARTAAPGSTLPTPWTASDVGAVGVAGTSSALNGVFTLAGAGADIWGIADAFHFVHQPLPGDGQIVARLTTQQNTHAYAKAGVMMRAGLGAGAAHVTVDIVPGGGVELLARSAAGGPTNYLGGTQQPLPGWLRLVRVGTVVTASVSADGTTWRSVGQTTLATGTIYVGLAVTSHDTRVRNTASFDNVSVR